MILHIDLDCFFVAAARIKDKRLIGKNVAVIGGGLNEDFGETNSDINNSVVLSASYEARKYGVKSAMVLKQAKVLCKNLIVVKSDHHFYKELSKKLYKFLYTFTPDIEQFSIDEFFLDLSGTNAMKDPLKFAKFLQNEILNKFELPSSIGISDAKFIAKLATDLAKPFGIKIIKKDDFDTVLKNIDISKFPGVGKSALKRLNKYGIFTIGDVKGSKFIFEKLGKSGIKLYENITGSGKNLVETNSKRKSFSHGRTFKAISNRDEIKRRILILCRYLCFDIYKLGQNPTKFELKIKYLDKITITRSLTYKFKFYEGVLHQIMNELFQRCDEFINKPIIYISVGVSGFVEEKNIEKTLFNEIKQSDIEIDKAVQVIREKYGVNSLLFAKEIKAKN